MAMLLWFTGNMMMMMIVPLESWGMVRMCKRKVQQHAG
jgi:hypothetical protein